MKVLLYIKCAFIFCPLTIRALIFKYNIIWEKKQVILELQTENVVEQIELFLQKITYKILILLLFIRKNL